MNRGFNIILAAQFFSALGDNALLFAAIALLKSLNAPAWQIPVLQQFFVIAFILLAPFAGAFSEALPKGTVMFISNAIKMFGCIALLPGLQNFNENLSILWMLGAYALMIKAELSINSIVIVFGLFLSIVMGWLTYRRGHDQD